MDGGVIMTQPAFIWSMWTWIKFYQECIRTCSYVLLILSISISVRQ